MFAIAWQYLTGKAVASDVADRQAPEWPPHPDRVFQAMVAAWGGADEPAAWADALRWLDGRSPPDLVARDGVPVPGPKVFVPVNDVSGSMRGAYGDTAIALLPAQRTRKERYFPATLVHDQICALIWRDAEPTVAVREALAALCRQVTHIGHSSSLVRMWVEPSPPAATWTPSPPVADSRHLRVPAAGRFDALVDAYRRARAACADRPSAPVPMPPRAGAVRYAPVSDRAQPRGIFGDRWIILRRTAGDPIHLPQTLAFTTALRDALNGAADAASRPFISGHPADSSAPSDQPHLAVVPLADVGHGHAQGRLLGFGLIAPQATPADAMEGLWRAVMHLANDAGIIRITFGARGAIDVVVEERPVPARALTTARWCAPSTDWATVTPVVLDRIPPRRHQHDDAWLAAELAQSCQRQGLPEPLAVRLLGASAFTGAPAARAMPTLLRKDGSRRWHLHAAFTFDQKVAGPLLIGAGRYRGYGLCAPLAEAAP
jgi:CRISPR-associated protein Csb2